MEKLLLAMGGPMAVFGGLLLVAVFADKHLDTKQLYFDLWSKGTPTARVAQVLKGGDRLFSYLFETKSGRFSILRSAVASAVACFLLQTLVDIELTVSQPSLVLGVVIVSAVGTLLPDALSLYQTRWLLKLYRRDGGSGVKLIFVDAVLTTFLIILCWPLLMYFVVYPGIWCSIIPYNSDFENPTDPNWLGYCWCIGAVGGLGRSIPWFDPTGGLVRWVFTDEFDIFGPLVSTKFPKRGNAAALVVLTGYITSVWLWITILGSWLALGLQKFNERFGYSLIARLNVESYPTTSLVLVTFPFFGLAGVILAVL